MTTPPDAAIAAQLAALRRRVITRAESFPRVLTHDSGQKASRDNLLAYAALREHDIVDLQLALSSMGLSSLGRLESNVLNGLGTVLSRLGIVPELTDLDIPAADTASAILAERCRTLLGRSRTGRSDRIMVTLDRRGASDNERVERLLTAGMDLVRINCAHESPDDWAAIIAGVRAAEASLEARDEGTGRRCRVSMDLAGPKLRTGALPTVPGPLKIAVPHDGGLGARGILKEAGAATPLGSDGESPAFSLDLAGADLATLHTGDRLTFDDIEGRPRELFVGRTGLGWASVTLHRTATVCDGIVLQREDALLGTLVNVVAPLELKVTAGDRIRMSRNVAETLNPAGSLTCTLPEALEFVRPGHRVYFDEGRIGAVVVSCGDAEIELEVISPVSATARVRAEKGLNFPDTVLGLPALTADDRAALPFVAAHADMVALSFVHEPADIEDLCAELDRLGRPDIGIVAKIETKEAIHNLVRILLAGLELPSFGVMIARGDLAVEVGFENLAFVQEDILCLCEAAHVPVIWATQVLESLARTGLPARAEITDAVAGQRADCVMLNKGAFVLRAVEVLSLLLGAADRHRIKKREVFREFTVQPDLFPENEA